MGPKLGQKIAAGIGFISEYRHHQKEQEVAKNATPTNELAASDDTIPTLRDASKQDAESHLDHSEAVEVVDSDERQWDLDEAQDELIEKTDTTEKRKEKTERDPAKMTKKFTDAHPLTEGFELLGLSLPVVLPQRRPKDRTRGFIRAYAPELECCDIDQDTFLQFIETFNQATLASPWLDAVNLASLALVTLPTPISMAVSVAIAIAVDITKNLQSRRRHGYVLDQMNEDFFRPRGLYALVLTWQPESNNSTVSVDINKTIAQNLTKPEGVVDKTKHNFRPSMGNTVGVAFTETAPLVFPAIDSLVNNNTPEAKEFKQKIKNAKKFLGDYMDRRAQAEYSGEHPDSQLATQPEFKSRYADPNHPASSGDLLSLVSGGRIRSPIGGLLGQRGGRLGGGGLLGGRGFQRRGFGGRGFSRFQSPPPNDYNSAYGQRVNQPYQGSFGEGGFGAGSGPSALLGEGLGGVKRVFQHHVLYLAIINMPSDEEMAAANEVLKQIEAQRRSS